MHSPAPPLFFLVQYVTTILVPVRICVLSGAQQGFVVKRKEILMIHCMCSKTYYTCIIRIMSKWVVNLSLHTAKQKIVESILVHFVRRVDMF